MKKSILKIKEIILDDRLYPRTEVNDKTIMEYKHCMEMGDIFPDLFVGFWKGKHYLLDGRHRLEAKKLLDEEYVSCDVITNFSCWDDLLLAAIRSNMKHGLRMNKKDRMKCALMLKDLNIDLEDISKITKLGEKDLSIVGVNFKSKIIKRKIGEGYYPSTFKDKVKEKEEIPIVDRKQVKEMEDKNKDDWQITQLNSTIDYFKTEKFNLKNPKITSRLHKMKKILHKRFPKL